MARLSLGFHVPAPGTVSAWLFTLAAPALMVASCLITSSPDFQAPPVTAPFLIADSTTKPDPRFITIVPNSEINKPIDFSARLKSEDNPQTVDGKLTGERVQMELLRDFGAGTDSGTKAQRIYPTDPQLPFAFDDEGRPAAAITYFNSDTPLEGCHTFTMVVSHALKSNGCPEDPNDASSLTWLVYFCGPDETMQCPGDVANLEGCISPAPADLAVCPPPSGSPTP